MFYGNTSVPIPLCIVNGCFCATTAELNSVTKIFCPQSLKHLLSDSLQKVPCPGLGDWSRKSLGNSETRRKQKK